MPAISPVLRYRLQGAIWGKSLKGNLAGIVHCFNFFARQAGILTCEMPELRLRFRINFCRQHQAAPVKITQFQQGPGNEDTVIFCER